MRKIILLSVILVFFGCMANKNCTESKNMPEGKRYMKGSFLVSWKNPKTNEWHFVFTPGTNIILSKEHFVEVVQKSQQFVGVSSLKKELDSFAQGEYIYFCGEEKTFLPKENAYVQVPSKNVLDGISLYCKKRNLNLTLPVADSDIKPTAEEIAKIENRGRQIADYERVAIVATDLLLADKPDLSKLGTYVAITNGKSWTVYFGKLSEDNKNFVVAYVYSGSAGAGEQMKPNKITGAVPSEVLQLAKAAKLVLASIKREFPKYNPDVFRENDGTISVYLMPGNEKPGVILLGGDFKVSVSSDGDKVLDSTKLHKSVLEMSPQMADGTSPDGAFHAHLLTDLPTETDIALILLNPQLAPHYIAGPEWFSRVDKTGKITVLGKTKEMLKPKKADTSAENSNKTNIQ